MLKLSLICLFMFSACSTPRYFSDEEISRLQNKRYEKSPYEKIFSSMRTVLESEGYSIKNSDLKGGYIMATMDGNDELSKINSQVSSFLNAGKNYPTSRIYEVSVNVEQSGEVVETKATLNKIEEYSMGGSRSEVVLDTGFYKEFYEKVQKSFAL